MDVKRIVKRIKEAEFVLQKDKQNWQIFSKLIDMSEESN